MSRSVSTTSDPWRGDIGAGVAAWTRGKHQVVEPGRVQPCVEQASAASGSKRARVETPPPDPVAEGPDADAESVARKILLDQLTGQARSRKELADKLAKKDVPAELAARLLDRFEEVGLIDDGAFARAWVASRQPGKGLARRALAQELRRKGIDDEVAREALDEIEPEDEEAAARALVRKKLRTLSRVDDTTATRRLVGLLARKGYPSGMAFSVVRDELSQADRRTPEVNPT
jgi:regulatory protein